MKVALLSVYDKTGITEIAEALHAMGWTLLASGGTARAIASAGIPVTDVMEYIGAGSMLDHRVVTIDRKLHAGLLARNIPEHLAELEALGMPFVSLVYVNTYPLVETTQREGVTLEDVIEATDIGGPTMIRSAAKGRRMVACTPGDMRRVLAWLAEGKPDEKVFMADLVYRAERYVGDYALHSARYHSGGRLAWLMGEREAECRYGENPHQQGAGFYRGISEEDAHPLAPHRYVLEVGGALSYNNYCDIHRLSTTMAKLAAGFQANFGEIPKIAIVVKHGNCCGAAVGEDSEVVMRRMILGDPLAIMGGFVMTNFPLAREHIALLRTFNVTDGETRKMDGVVAPSFDEEFLERVRRQKKISGRYLTNNALADLSGVVPWRGPMIRPLFGGDFLAQDSDAHVFDNIRDLTHFDHLPQAIRAPVRRQERDLVLAWAIGSTSNSNTITLVKDGMLIANAVGQQARVRAAKLAVWLAGENGHDTMGAAAYSDAFFPFTDGPVVLHSAGIRAVLSVSGSVNDERVMAYCAAVGMELYLMDKRGFFGH